LIDHYIEKYGKRLYGLCVTLCADKFDADDLYQETWLKAYRKISQYDEKRSFEGWLTAICVNTYRDYLRKKRILKLFDCFNSTEEKEEYIQSVPEKVNEDFSQLREAIESLPEKLRLTVVLFYFHDMKISEVAESMGIPEGTVKSRLNLARQKLRKELSDEQDF